MESTRKRLLKPPGFIHQEGGGGKRWKLRRILLEDHMAPF